jgi:hypothetical protein
MGIMDSIMESGIGGRWFKFESKGDTVEGVIESVDERQCSFNKEPLFWDDGNPRMEVVFTLRTAQSDDEDDSGLRKFSVHGWGIQHDALRTACKQLGRAAEPGDIMSAAYTGKQGNAKVYVYTLSAGAAVAPEPTDVPF